MEIALIICLHLAETEIQWRKDDGKNLNTNKPRSPVSHIIIKNSHLPNPPYFSLYTTFKYYKGTKRVWNFGCGSELGSISSSTPPCYGWILNCKKSLAIFPSAARVSLTKLSPLWESLVSDTSRLGTGKPLIFFYSVDFFFWGGDFFSFYIQHCFICRPSDSTVPTDAGIVPRTVATGALAVRRSNH